MEIVLVVATILGGIAAFWFLVEKLPNLFPKWFRKWFRRDLPGSHPRDARGAESQIPAKSSARDVPSSQPDDDSGTESQIQIASKDEARMSVSDNFRTFCSNLTITNRDSISNRYRRITKRLNTEYWASESETAHSLYVGSYGRGTAIRGFSDLDMIFTLPYSVYQQYDRYAGNGQSALLQSVRNAIKKTYATTDIGADGQVVVVPFNDGITFEVVPAFTNTDGGFTYPDSNSGGRWKTTNPKPEIATINDYTYSENLKWLCRMTRAWKGKHNVPMGGLLIDTLAYRFIKDWQHRDKGKVYYDWMSRDFFFFLSKEDPGKSYWHALGSNQLIYRKGKFEYKAKLAYNKAVEAINAQTNEYWYSAKSTWGEIYGSAYPS